MKRFEFHVPRLALLAVAAVGLFTLPSCIHHHGFSHPFRSGHGHGHHHRDHGGGHHDRPVRRARGRRARRR